MNNIRIIVGERLNPNHPEEVYELFSMPTIQRNEGTIEKAGHLKVTARRDKVLTLESRFQYVSQEYDGMSFFTSAHEKDWMINPIEDQESISYKIPAKSYIDIITKLNLINILESRRYSEGQNIAIALHESYKRDEPIVYYDALNRLAKFFKNSEDIVKVLKTKHKDYFERNIKEGDNLYLSFIKTEDPILKKAYTEKLIHKLG